MPVEYSNECRGASGPLALTGIALVIACVAVFAFAYRKPEKLRARSSDSHRIYDHPRRFRPARCCPHSSHFFGLSTPAIDYRRCCQARLERDGAYRTGRIVIVLACGSGLRSIATTEGLIHETGGRGRWSDSLDRFCRENRNRSDLTIVSLDWGFNEQLMFLTDGPQLSEPFWNFNQTLPPLPENPNYIYLAHPPEYSALKYDVAYLSQLQGNANVEITPYVDRQKGGVLHDSLSASVKHDFSSARRRTLSVGNLPGTFER